MMHPSRRAYVEDSTDEGNSMADIAMQDDVEELADDVNAKARVREIYELSLERKKRAEAMIVPTDDARVRMRLRELGEPIMLFGEPNIQRRDRLREVLMVLSERDVPMEDAATPQEEVAGEGDPKNEEFFTQGPDELLAARKTIAIFSLHQARNRINRLKEEAKIPLKEHQRQRQAIYPKLNEVKLYGSLNSDNRPISICRFSPDGQILATGSWSGNIKLYSVPNLEEKLVLAGGHKDRVGGIAWHPGASSSSTVNLISGGGEGDVNLWSLDSKKPLATLRGHTGRVCRTEFHPMGRYAASASYDYTWRLWDIETQQELLYQEGHSLEVYAVSFNKDGSLVASGGLDSHGYIWDLRTGRRVMALHGHMGEIYSIDWHPDATRLLTASADGWVKCWDLRQSKCTAQVGAHSSVVTDVRWYKGNGSATFARPKAPPKDESADRKDTGRMWQGLQPKNAGTFFLSAGFDKTVKIWGCDDWEPVKKLEGHSGNVLSTDISEDAKWIASSGHDRTVKIWGYE
ncbi:hypothetical protein N7495_004593 [Penicillium taxi]|uniref:uncharacterized protein n=1 Tax=Penicillium taxi TaxID=168475 RepID=UPI002545B7E8|nr:uncharacterized protein N7495_004593 [Penicillium taxi]KAJ5899849.1 hypothetical protein N7495_004593 [Penicillium taxi]